MQRAPVSRPFSSLEILEARIAPAGLFTFTDADGNLVSIKTSKGTDAQLAQAIGPAIQNGSLTPTQLLTIDFSGNLAATFKGTDLTIVAGASAVDAIFTKIGFINATGLDLGKVTVDGELNRIAAGDGNSKTAGLRALSVTTFGKFDVTPGTQGGEFDSRIVGALKALTVVGDLQGIFLNVVGSDSESAPEPKTNRDGGIGDIFIGGSLLGTDRDFGGSIFATGDIGNLEIVGDLKGLAGAGMAVEGQDRNGHVSSGRSIGAVVIGGSLIGGDGLESGHITSGFGIRSLTVGDVLGGFGKVSGVVGSGGTLGKIDVEFSVTGGVGEGSGAITSFGNMQAVTIGLNLSGGMGENSGWVAAGGSLASVTIGQDLTGGSGSASGEVGAIGKIGSITVGRNLIGGTSFETGAIGSLTGIGKVLIKGSILAGAGERSGSILTDGLEDFSAPIGSVTVLGSIDSGDENGGEVFRVSAVGGPAGANSASILAGGNLGTVVIGGGVTGGIGVSSSNIAAKENIKSVEIGGTLAGGAGNFSGKIDAGGTIGSVSLGELQGGGGDFSGVIFSATKLSKVTIQGNVNGGFGTDSGVIMTSNASAVADIGTIFIGGNLVGGNRGDRAGSIVSDGKIGSIVIGDPKSDHSESFGGHIIGGNARGGGSITSQGDLVSIKIKGSIQGGYSNNTGRIFTASDIGSLTVGSSIFGGSGSQITFDTNETSNVGQVYAGGKIGKVDIGVVLSGGGGDYTAQIRAHTIGKVTVGGIFGDQGEGSGSIVAFGDNISSVDIVGYEGEGFEPGRLVAGSGFLSGAIAARSTISSVTTDFVEGSIFGRARISAGDSIKTVSIRDTIEFSDIFAGYDPTGVPSNGDAQIGTVKIGFSSHSEGGGGMIGTNIIAGALSSSSANGDNVFGTADDAPIQTPQDKSNVYSRIASVIITGDVRQAPSNGSGPIHFGIVAQSLGSIKVNGVSRPIEPGPGNDPLIDSVLVGTANDTTYGEVSASSGPVIGQF